MSEDEIVKNEVEKAKSSFKNFLGSNKYTIIAISVAITTILQAYFMYKSNTQHRGHSLLVITKSPIRFISRWDTVKEVEMNVPTTSDHIVNLTQRILDSNFTNYRFNENLYIRVNSVDVKSDEATVNLNESSTIDDKITEDRIR